MMSRKSRQYKEITVNPRIKEILKNKCAELGKTGRYTLGDDDLLDILLECESEGISISRRELDKYMSVGGSKGEAPFQMHEELEHFPCSYCGKDDKSVKIMRLTTGSVQTPHFTTFICRECADKLATMLSQYASEDS